MHIPALQTSSQLWLIRILAAGCISFMSNVLPFISDQHILVKINLSGTSRHHTSGSWTSQQHQPNVLVSVHRPCHLSGLRLRDTPWKISFPPMLLSESLGCISHSHFFVREQTADPFVPTPFLCQCLPWQSWKSLCPALCPHLLSVTSTQAVAERQSAFCNNPPQPPP